MENADGIRSWTCTGCGGIVLDGRQAEWRDGTRLADTVRLFVDGNKIGALIGRDLVQGVAGFGYSVHEALHDLANQLVKHGVWIEVADPENPLGGTGLEVP